MRWLRRHKQDAREAAAEVKGRARVGRKGLRSSFPTHGPLPPATHRGGAISLPINAHVELCPYSKYMSIESKELREVSEPTTKGAWPHT